MNMHDHRVLQFSPLKYMVRDLGLSKVYILFETILVSSGLKSYGKDIKEDLPDFEADHSAARGLNGNIGTVAES